jgi:hypothetical protein
VLLVFGSVGRLIFLLLFSIVYVPLFSFMSVAVAGLLRLLSGNFMLLTTSRMQLCCGFFVATRVKAFTLLFVICFHLCCQFVCDFGSADL